MPKLEPSSLTRPLAAYAAKLLRVRWFVRAPIVIYRARMGFVFGSRLLMLEHTGRKTGARRRVVLEVVDHRRRGTYVVASGFGARAQWFRNVRASPGVRVWVGRHVAAPATARLLGNDEAAATLSEYAGRHPRAWTALRQVFDATLGTGEDGREPALPLVAFDIEDGLDVPRPVQSSSPSAHPAPGGSTAPDQGADPLASRQVPEVQRDAPPPSAEFLAQVKP